MGNKEKVILKCSNCGGKGKIAEFSHIDDGMCYVCKGKGKFEYTQEEYKKMQAEEAENKRIAEERRKEEWANPHFLERQHKTMQEGVFIPLVWNTFKIKEELKSKGFKFSDVTGWYIPANQHPELNREAQDLPDDIYEGIEVVYIAFDALFEVGENVGGQIAYNPIANISDVTQEVREAIKGKR